MIRVAVLTSPDFRAALRGFERVDSLADAEVVLIAPRFGSTLRDSWETMANVRWIHSLGAGVETLPFDLLRQRRDIVVTNSRGIYADALAEFAIASMLWFAKDFRRLMNQQASRRWEPYEVQRIEGATLGIIGYGSIGRAVARRAEALGMRILATRATPVDDAIQCDYVVLSVPLTPETRGLLNRERIARLRGVLINLSRGAVVDEEALVEALQQRRIRGAALDVFATEPLPHDHPLWALDNVLISPHSADHTNDSHDRAMELFLRNLEHFRRGGPLENVVNVDREY